MYRGIRAARLSNANSSIYRLRRHSERTAKEIRTRPTTDSSGVIAKRSYRVFTPLQPVRPECFAQRNVSRDPRAQHLNRSEEHTSELQSLMRISYAVFCLTKKKKQTTIQYIHNTYI